MRARGLKLDLYDMDGHVLKLRLVQARGLKQRQIKRLCLKLGSCPAQVRGFKQHRRGRLLHRVVRRAHTGAWIETGLRWCLWQSPTVAPSAGAWIETKRAAITTLMRRRSRPARACGVK